MGQCLGPLKDTTLLFLWWNEAKSCHAVIDLRKPNKDTMEHNNKACCFFLTQTFSPIYTHIHSLSSWTLCVASIKETVKEKRLANSQLNNIAIIF